MADEKKRAEHVSAQVVTVVGASVDATRGHELTTAFQALGRAPLPEGVLGTELLRGPEGRWRIQTHWRDRASLEALLSGSETPTAKRIFQQVGAESSLTVFESVAVQWATPRRSQD